jgi:hypothetical protein
MKTATTPKQRKIIGYDGPSGAYVVTDGKILPLSEPAAVVALVDSALLTSLGYSEKAAEYQRLAQGRKKLAVARAG